MTTVPHKTQPPSTVDGIAFLQEIGVPTSVPGFHALFGDALPRFPASQPVLRAINEAGRREIVEIVHTVAQDYDKHPSRVKEVCAGLAPHVTARSAARLASATADRITAGNLGAACAALEAADKVTAELIPSAAAHRTRADEAVPRSRADLARSEEEFIDAQRCPRIFGIPVWWPSLRRIRRTARQVVLGAEVHAKARIAAEIAGAACALIPAVRDQLQERSAVHSQHATAASGRDYSVPVRADEASLTAVCDVQPNRQWAENVAENLVSARATEYKNRLARDLARGADLAETIDGLSDEILTAANPVPSDVTAFLLEVEPDTAAFIADRERLAAEQALRDPLAQTALKRREARLLEAPGASRGGPLVDAFKAKPTGAFTHVAESVDPLQVRFMTEERGLAVNAFTSFRTARAIARTLSPQDLLPMLTCVTDLAELLALDPDEDPVETLVVLLVANRIERDDGHGYKGSTTGDGTPSRIARGYDDLLERITGHDEVVSRLRRQAEDAIRAEGRSTLRERLTILRRRASDYVPAAAVARFRDALERVGARLVGGNEGTDGNGVFSPERKPKLNASSPRNPGGKGERFPNGTSGSGD
jgi:hypothetical protein